jgi:glycosyltransferase involved in cell wall biosynthesis
MRGNLEKHAEQLRISESVIFTGWRNDIDEALKAIDILVLCSTTETQGLVILEAMSFGKPVIATDINQIGETVVDGETGRLVPANDVNALAEVMLELSGNRNMAEQIGKQARLFVEQEHSLERMVTQTLAVYEAFCSK